MRRLFLAFLLMLLPASAAAEIFIRIEPAMVNGRGLPWDTGLGAVFQANPADILPDIAICLSPSQRDIGTCAAVCTDQRTCEGRFQALPPGAKFINIYDVDRTNAWDPMYSIALEGIEDCAPCTVSGPAPEGRFWVVGLRPPGPVCRPFREVIRDPSWKPLVDAYRLILSRGDESKRDLQAFRQSGKLELCSNINLFAYYHPEEHRVVINEVEAAGKTTDLYLRVLFEELAHATDRVSRRLDPGDPSRQPATAKTRWVTAYVDAVINFEAQGQFAAALDREFFRRNRIANPPAFLYTDRQRASNVDYLVAEYRAGRVGRAQAVSLLEFGIRRVSANIDGQPERYEDAFRRQGERIWACGREGRVRQSPGGLWVCG